MSGEIGYWEVRELLDWDNKLDALEEAFQRGIDYQKKKKEKNERF
jgi:hypothetical protein